ncbi:hypothetical protein ACFOON_12825 [Novosphingobium piscinae]|uniref:Uncharacterized protein n=1 Tax=Novosphingobium piscinae TaxID=1507448 RepID=A0A7X1G180_9SPHN|nr:hypothetical protein [Novosphingobium piscinae]MBC2670748.1 hypothetical protein [Novosphingobium piscinae]
MTARHRPHPWDRLVAPLCAAAALAAAAPLRAESDLFIGTLTLNGSEVVLERCDLARTVYVLRDDPAGGRGAVARFRARPIPAYAEVIGRYEEQDGRPALAVQDFATKAAGRDCHLVTAVAQLAPVPEGAPPRDLVADAAGNRITALPPEPDAAGRHCTASGDWCVALGFEDEAIVATVTTPATGASHRIVLPDPPHDSGFDHSELTVWPVLIRLGGGGEMFGVITEERAMLSGGGASAARLSLYRAAGDGPAEPAIDLPWDANALIRACFSEKDVRQRRGACHDEYGYAASLELAPGGTPGAPVLRYRALATSYPGAVSRGADSLAARPLRKGDLVRVTDPACTFTRLLRFDPATGRFTPEAPLPDCSDYRAL